MCFESLCFNHHLSLGIGLARNFIWVFPLDVTKNANELFVQSCIFFFNFLFDFFNDPGYLVTYFPTSMCFCVLCCIFLLLIYNKKNAWYGLNFPKFTEICSVAHHVIYPAECLICTWEECVFCCFWIESSIKYQSSLSSLMCHLRPVFSYWFFSPNDLSIDVTEVTKSPLLLCCCFSFYDF